ncbi:oligopeptide ABC transporter substrate-binding protein [Psychrobacillus vulpis]|uniref:Oligopeptide ABC transporter substrate-binding protein n=1 Tax=Psychrobacillus vulpis TaxID=2325572 RepID=A0A544TS04_9BACI|nr:oligopeptide ABC transporter substrate-binding protein [Psychrobacillus vulpis]TQR20226.1 oligopeptide ABC transporter substrate-binding protein [Psychrobacillus vulpis]
MSKKLWALLVILLAFMLVLGACKGSENSSEGNTETTPKETEKEKEEKPEEKTEEPAETSEFPLIVDNEGEAIKGGTLKVALGTDSPFQGIFSWVLYEDGYDADIMAYSSNAIFATDGDFLVNDKGIATLEVDQANNKAIVKIREGVKWSDGEPLKIEDLILPYLIIGHPDYQGIRYDGDFQNIVGAVEYHDGKADTISGLKKIDETTLEISFQKLSPAIFSVGDGLWSYAEPNHILKDIPIGQLLESDAVRKNPVTLGAFKIDKIVPGESVQFVRNEHYWKGPAKLDGVLLKAVPSTSIAAAIQSGEYDMTAGSLPATKYPEVKDFDNITILAQPELSYSYLGFKLGKFDTVNGISVMDPNAKMGDVKLRQAMGYALDVEQVNEVYYDNLRSRANSLIPPVFKSFYDSSLKGYYYDKDKAIEILDGAGYKDTDGDGFRETPKGEKLEIKMAGMAGDAIAEEMAAFWMQNWADVGLKVVLSTGRLIEFQTFYDKVEVDDPEIDIYMAAWGTGTNPSPAGLYGKNAAFNFSRFTTPELDALLTAIDSPDAFDPAFRANAFREWQEYMEENAQVIPTQFRTAIYTINDRVKHYDVNYDTEFDLNEVELTADAPAKSTK